ncbi:MAG: chromophore lyase [Prevotella sp.]|nr:chromophore lyase [Prevotella sp.]
MRIFKSTLLCVIASMAFATSGMAQISEYDYNEPVGWATLGARQVTGGNEENPVLVTTYDELVAELKGTDYKTIYVQGEIQFPGPVLKLSSVQNKTIYGLPGSAFVNPYHTANVDSTGILSLSSCQNFIIRNVTFKSAGAYDIDGNDNLNFTGCKYMWVDHCDFQDGVDGNFDCNNGSDYICVSWCRFHYLISPWSGGSGGSNDHRFSNLWGGSDSNATKDKGHLNTTFYSCWWDDGCKERMPRIRFGQVHLLNCLYSCTGNNYCVGTGYMSNVYIDRCTFVDGIKYPYKNYATSGSYTDYNLTVSGCLGVDDYQHKSGDNDYFIPSEKYELEGYDVDLVETEVSTHAGATLNITYGEGIDTGIGQIISSDTKTVGINYYSPSGMKLSQPQKGMNIVVRQMSDGTIKTTKEIIK